MTSKGANKSKSASSQSDEKESSGALAVVIGMLLVFASLGASSYGGPYALYWISIIGIGVILIGLAVYLHDILQTLREIRDK